LLRGRAAAGTVTLDDGGTLVIASAAAGDVFVVVHPTAISLHRERPEGTPRNVWPGTIAGVEPVGDPASGRMRVRIGGERPLVAEVTPAAVAALRLDQGGAIWASVKATEIDAYPA